MVGGKVIEIADVPGRPEAIYVDVRDKNDTCAILVERNENSERIQIGDSLWWQSGYAMWTPQENADKTCDHEHHYSCQRCGVDYDIRIPRIGYSGVVYPGRKDER